MNLVQSTGQNQINCALFCDSVVQSINTMQHYLTFVFSQLVRGGRETTVPALSFKQTIPAGSTYWTYL